MTNVGKSIRDSFPTGSYDAIVVGGGHNGLVCAAYLAKAGKKTLVLEGYDTLGGATLSKEFFPGFTFSAYSYVVSLFRPHIIRELNLTRHGYEILPLDCTFSPFPDGDSLARWADPGKSRKEVARFSPKDADTLPFFGMAMSKITKLVKAVIDDKAPDPTSLAPGDLAQLAKMARLFHLQDADVKYVALKLLTMSAADFLDMWFESDHLKGPMSCSGIIGTCLGVRSPGTAYVLLHHYMGEIDGAFRSWGFSKGGTGGVALACARSAASFGAEIRTDAKVARILMKDNKACGVVMEDGREIRAKVVLSSADPRRTFFNMVGKEHLDSEFITQIDRYKYRGSSGKVNMAVDRLPEFTSRPGFGPHLLGDITFAPGVDYMEKAYDDAKYGDFSQRPFIDMVIPSLTDPTLAPAGKHMISCFVQYAPYHIKEGADYWPNRREAFGDAVIDTLEAYIPNIKDIILHRQVLTPWDMEQNFGLTEGNIFHGELSLEQLLFLRPAAGWSRYKTPIENLWLCASGTHPGGGIMGSPGELAAKTLLQAKIL